MAHTVESFEPLTEACNARQRSEELGSQYPRILAIDLRGHGKSIARGKDTLSFQDLPQHEFAKYPTDVQQVIEGVTADTTLKIRKDDITIIGASIGANTAALLTVEMPYIKRIVLLSPGLNYKGLEPADAIMTFNGQILLVASQGDEYSYNSVREMAALNPDHCTLMIFEGDAHGTDIINGNPDAMQALVDWLLKN